MTALMEGGRVKVHPHVLDSYILIYFSELQFLCWDMRLPRVIKTWFLNMDSN
jgi:hypothetical protein